ncbi:hypothetical protein I7I48_00233 [Histoplasma ohiense]|nr:hypothetical protein I7I48_00233 [Histoplasma ohiense (nom. inval.)]
MVWVWEIVNSIPSTTLFVLIAPKPKPQPRKKKSKEKTKTPLRVPPALPPRGIAHIFANSSPESTPGQFMSAFRFCFAGQLTVLSDCSSPSHHENTLSPLGVAPLPTIGH